MLTVEKQEINEGKNLCSQLQCYYYRLLRRPLVRSGILLSIVKVYFDFEIKEKNNFFIKNRTKILYTSFFHKNIPPEIHQRLTKNYFIPSIL